MIMYSRVGIYNQTLKAKKIEIIQKPKPDYINIFLGILLIIVLAMFFIT